VVTFPTVSLGGSLNAQRYDELFWNVVVDFVTEMETVTQDIELVLCHLNLIISVVFDASVTASVFLRLVIFLVIKTAAACNLQIAVSALRYSASVLGHFVLDTPCSSKIDIWSISGWRGQEGTN
jgi:hypothetical protein